MESLKLRFMWLLMIPAILMLAGVSAKAAEDTFDVVIGEDNEFIDGGGTGYNTGTWYYYPNTDWWNQWFYNGPYDPQRKKVIDLSLTIKLRAGAQQGYVRLAYNWSTPAWSAKGEARPPLPDDVPDTTTENEYIQRNSFFTGTLKSSPPDGSGTMKIGTHYEIADYNPEWVSIDVQGYNFVIEDGWIKHECVDKGAPQPGQIRGIKWEDTNGNGYRDFLEAGLANWKIYLDEDSNGQWDADEPFQITDVVGRYQFTNLPADTYTVAEVPQNGWQQTYPTGETHTVVLGPGQIVTGVDFGNRQPPPEELDFGDAPRPYPTLLTHDGARHRIGGPWLGNTSDTPDAETNGQPNFMARGDDYDGNDDEQGVSSLRLVRGASVNVYVDVSGGGYVSAWVDFNRDGDWNDPGEQVHSDLLPEGHNAILVTAPSNSVMGMTFARFRISSHAGLSPTGLADDGEVEDHSVWIFPW